MCGNEIYEYSQKLLEIIDNFNKSKTDKVDAAIIKRAINFASHFHEGYFRKSGEPYITHPISVATLTAGLRFTTEAICSAILHDTVEDTKCTYDDIKAEFGNRIAEIVCKLTRIKEGKKMTIEQLVEDLRKTNDIDAKAVKICDRFHNMCTISSMTPQKQKDTAKETMKHFLVLCEDMDMIQIEELLCKMCISICNINTELNTNEDEDIDLL